MKYIFVVHGRTAVSNGVFEAKEPDDEYEDDIIEEIYFDSFSKVLDVYESFDEAYLKFQSYVNEAFDNVQNAPPKALDPVLIKESCFAELFKSYNQNAYRDGDIQWSYTFKEGEKAYWQMYAVAPDMSIGCPILPGLYLEKKVINE